MEAKKIWQIIENKYSRPKTPAEMLEVLTAEENPLTHKVLTELHSYFPHVGTKTPHRPENVEASVNRVIHYADTVLSSINLELEQQAILT